MALMASWTEPTPSRISLPIRDSDRSSSESAIAAIDDWFEHCRECGKRLRGRGRWKHCHACAADQRRSGVRRSVKAARLNEAQRLINRYGQVEGERAFKRVDAFHKWLGRHPRIKNVFVLHERTPLSAVRTFLVAAALDEAPLSPVSLETWVQEQISHLWQLLRTCRETEVAERAQALSITAQIRGCRHAKRVALECQDVILDAGLPVNSNLHDALCEIDRQCNAQINGWRGEGDGRHFAAGMLRRANKLRAFPFHSPSSHSDAAALVDCSRRFLKLNGSADANVLMLRREAAHRDFQLAVREENWKKAEREINLVAELGARVDRPTAKIHSLALQATYCVSQDNPVDARDYLDQAWIESAKIAIPRTTSWALLRAEIEFGLKYGNEKDVSRHVERFEELFWAHPCPYQLHCLQRWRPEGYRSITQVGSIIKVILPPLIDYFVSDL